MIDMQNVLINTGLYDSNDIVLLHGEMIPEEKKNIMKSLNEVLKNKYIFMFTPVLTMGSSLILPQFTKHINMMTNIVDP